MEGNVSKGADEEGENDLERMERKLMEKNMVDKIQEKIKWGHA